MQKDFALILVVMNEFDTVRSRWLGIGGVSHLFWERKI